MAIKLSELFGSMDEAFNNPKLEEMFNKTKDVAENMSKKSAERLEISRKKVELLDAKAKLSKLYEKFGKLQYSKYIGEEVSDEEITDCANAIADNKEKVQLYTAEMVKMSVCKKYIFKVCIFNKIHHFFAVFSADNKSAFICFFICDKIAIIFKTAESG